MNRPCHMSLPPISTASSFTRNKNLIHAIPEELYGALPAGVTEKNAPADVGESSNGTKLKPI